jgi:surface antigen
VHTRRWTRHALVVALVWAATTLLVPTPQAGATSSLLCQGFTGCANAGYSNFGYGPKNYTRMWWLMYSGHNCTNYMAYRMIRSGLPVNRPWSSSGDARYWGVVFKSKTNQTPLVGSVAWWSSNHVAYVQQIIDANTIVISEDHYGGDFDWRRIVRSGGGWPTGFIHLADETVTPTAPPTVIGTPQVDAPLSVKPGTWNRTGATYTYQWLANGTAITGATATSYTPTPAEVGDAISVKVTAAKTGYRAGSSTTGSSRSAAS